jgi:hypothetical protein
VRWASNGHATKHHVAIVYSPRGILFLSVAGSPQTRDRDVIEYVRRQAYQQLAPWTRDRVLDLLERGAHAEAVQTYFIAVGREWDQEWLHLDVVDRSG